MMFTRTVYRLSLVLLDALAFYVAAPLASAHDLAIDQVMLWPDPVAGTLRGQLTFDPELTRPKDAQPSPEYERKVLSFLESNVQLTLNGQALPLSFEVRELWVRGGATVGDLVVFSVPLPGSAREVRLFAGDAFNALVVSVQRVTRTGEVDTTSWLLRRGEWTPVYRIGAGWQEAGWRDGGPDVFLEAAGHVPVISHSPAPSADARTARPASLAVHFMRLGFEHILPGGIDHMLFVAGLVLGSARRYRQVLISLSLFTVAHTLTLGLGNFAVLHAPADVVEPLIAFSIFLLGVDNLRSRPALNDRRDNTRYGVVFCFGLIHGLGFANALSELAFDRAHVVLALFSFNLGVELGQVAVVALLGVALFLLRSRRPLERYATLFGSTAIALSGLFMIIQRLAQIGDVVSSISQTESCRHEA
jgi:hypothetical protein